MACFIFTCGTHTFTRQLQGYENVTVQCQNCGNFSGKCYTRWEWFTLCFVPLIPFSLRPYKEVGCRICNFYQDLKYRPDVETGHANQNQIPMQNYGGSGGPPQQQQQQQQPQLQQQQSYGAPPGGPNGPPGYK